jgi:integrase
MTEREVEVFLEKLDGNILKGRNTIRCHQHKLFRLFVEFLLNTGLRRNEALGLRSQYIDLQKGAIYIEKTKNKQMRIIPVNRRVREILAELPESLFSEFTSAVVTRRFNAIAKQAGLKGFKLHSLRHTFASMLVARGVDIYTVSKLLGHSDIKTTMIYAKLGMDALQLAVDRLAIGNHTGDNLLPDSGGD